MHNLIEFILIKSISSIKLLLDFSVKTEIINTKRS